MTRVLLAYSGGAEGTAAIRLLAEQYCQEVVTLTLDLGQGGDVMAVRDRALAAGAVRAHVIDAREQLAREYLLPFVQAGLPAGAIFPIARLLGRPLVAKRLIEVARLEGAAVVAHAGTDSAWDLQRLDRPFRDLAPDLRVVAPTRGMARRAWMPYAGRDGDAIQTSRRQLPAGASLWGRWAEYLPGDGSVDPPENVYALTRPPQACPDEPAYMEIQFDRGMPVRANEIEMPLVELLESVETIAGAHGVGRVTPVTEPLDEGSRTYAQEAPGPIVLRAAHEHLERRGASRKAVEDRRGLALLYRNAVAGGSWFSGDRNMADTYRPVLESRVCGAVWLKLWRGECRVVGS